MQVRSPLQALLRQARQRQVANLFLSQASFAIGVTAAGLILLLLAGTELLDWRWLVLLFFAAFTGGIFRALRRLPSEYRLAQQIDRRLNLLDNLSTALFFRTPAGRHGAPELRAAQQEQAEALTRGITPSAALPFAVPRELKTAALLGLAAFGLFGLRYGLSGSLDLRPPIARAVFDLFGGATKETAGMKKAPNPQRPLKLDGEGVALDPTQAVSPNSAEASAAGPDRSDTPGAEPLRSRSKGNDPAGKSAGDEPTEANDAAPATGRKDDTAGEADRNDNPSAQPPAKSKSNGPNEDSDLLSKLKNAMADLLAKLKIQPPMTESERSVAGKQGSENGKLRQTADRRGTPGPGKPKSGDAQGAEQQPGQPGESAENAQASRGQAGDKGSGTPDSRRERSGIGKEDGAKDIKEAEQMAAMGKISEILGKRARNLTGEVMVEVASSQNQLKTAYSQRNAKHSDIGGEIHRDEIPLIFQDYVQQYFEEVRKAAALPPAAVESKGQAAPGTGK